MSRRSVQLGKVDVRRCLELERRGFVGRRRQSTSCAPRHQDRIAVLVGLMVVVVVTAWADAATTASRRHRRRRARTLLQRRRAVAVVLVVLVIQVVTVHRRWRTRWRRRGTPRTCSPEIVSLGLFLVCLVVGSQL